MCPRSRSCRAAGSRVPTSSRRPSAATTVRWPTSRRASRSCATTATPSSCPRPAPTATPLARSRPATAAPSRGSAHRPLRCGDRHPLGLQSFRSPAPLPGSCMVGVAQLVEHRVVVRGSRVQAPSLTPGRPAPDPFVGRIRGRFVARRRRGPSPVALRHRPGSPRHRHLRRVALPLPRTLRKPDLGAADGGRLTAGLGLPMSGRRV